MSNFIIDKGLDAEIIAGTATAGIPPASWIADMLNLPMIYVRGEKKDHGKGNQIEGVMRKGARVVLIEDLISTGKSSLAAIDAIRETGGKIDTCLAFLDYGFPQTAKRFASKKVNLFTLTNFDELVKTAHSLKLIPPKEEKLILRWKQDPWNWVNKTKPPLKPKTVDY